MKYRDTYRIMTQVSRYVSHRDFRYRATPSALRFILLQQPRAAERMEVPSLLRITQRRVVGRGFDHRFDAKYAEF